ncbi:MAG: hypothetical protein NZ601_04290 [candidate division WOR-3 bacterium]|nr:hypothetical protein [candidate division WOR-3 bacterium]
MITGILVKNISPSAPVMSCTMRSGVQGVFKSLPDAGNYYWIDSDTIGGPSFNWIDITETGNVLGTGDNALYWFRLPYNFYFYGVNYDTVWVSTNGWISFGINPNTSAQSNTSIPSTAAPNRAVYVFWDDLNIVASDGGNIYYQTLGTFPNRYTVITWNNAQIKNSAYTFNQITFQVILYENGKIIMQYKDCAVGDSVYNWGRNATIGIENATGTIGLQYLYNGAPLGNLVTNERAIQFFRTDFNDVEVVRIEVPANAFDSTGPITPRVRVRNNGTEIETFNVTLKIGTGYTATRSKTLGVGVEDTVTFPLWTPQRGSYPVKCSLFLSGDIIPANNVLSTSTLVGVNDIQVVAINYPVGTIDSGGAIYPKATVKNHSALAKTFNLIFKISNGYTNTRAITLNPGAQDTVSFSLWTGIRGLYTTRCSSALIGDIFSVNDTLSGSFTLQVRDVGVVAIVAPADTIERGDLSPKATIRNYGSVPESFYAYFKIYSSTGSLVYTDSIYINNLNSNNQTTRTFRSFKFYQGTYHVRCSTALANDMNPTNNVKFKDVYVRYTPPWVRRRDVPVGPSAKPVGGGGALVAGGGRIYLLKGNNTREFFVYNPDGDSWTLLESIPFIADSSKKKVNKGAALAYNNHANPDVIYATKGNNTLEFWMYNIQLDTWIRKAPVPIEYPVKKVKGGASLVYLKRGNVQYVYLLKGNNTNEFYGYRCDTDAWITDLKRPPLGPNLKAYKDGSCMVVGYNNYIYLLKGGAPTNEFYAYVPSGDSWITLETLPRYSRLLGRSSKVSDGASMCYDGDSLIYVIKGGNKQDFWCYNAIRRTWKELDTIPKDLSRKAPKSGSALVYLDKKIYLVKGNKTYEFWRYIPGISDVPVARVSLIPQLTDDKTSFSASHSKIKFINDYKNSKVRMQLNLDQKQRLRINIYNSLGQLVDNFFDSELSAGNYEFTISNDNFARGVYLIKCFIEDHEQSFKWVLR